MPPMSGWMRRTARGVAPARLLQVARTRPRVLDEAASAISPCLSVAASARPPASMAHSPAFLVRSLDAPVGPVPVQELRRLYSLGHFSAHTLVSETGEAWVRIDKALNASASPSLHSAPGAYRGFVSEDTDDFDDDPQTRKRLPSSLSQVKSTVKNLGSSIMGKEIVRTMVGKRRVSLNEEEMAAAAGLTWPTSPSMSSPSLSAAPSSPSISIKGDIATGTSASAAAAAATAAVTNLSLSGGVPSPAPLDLKRSSSTPTRRALRALSTGMDRIATGNRSPQPSPRMQSHGSEVHTFTTDEEDAADPLSSVRSLALALNQALEQVDRLETSMKTKSPRQDRGMREAQLESENEELKGRIKALRSLVAERAPALLSDVDEVLGASAPSTGSAGEATTVTASFKPIPFEADSPMLRERMSKAEAFLDQLRQSLKVCVKSGQAFMSQSNQGEEGKRSFAADLSKTGSYLLDMLGQLLSADREEKEALLARFEADLVLPLASFANLDLKRANYVSVELERRREAFDTLESRLLAHRRAKESRLPTRSTSLTGGGEESQDKGSMDALNAELAFEQARCQLIRVINELTVEQMVEINKCTLDVATAISRYYSAGATNASKLLALARLAVDGNAELVRGKEAWERAWQVKSAEIEARRQYRSNRVFLSRRLDAEADLVFEGWLYKRSSNVIKDWKKRFFQLKGGQFVYFRAGRMEQVADLLMCSVKDAPKLGVGAFEVASNLRVVALQACSEEEKDAWIQAIRRAAERLIGSKGQPVQDDLLSLLGGPTTTASAMDSDDEEDLQCADCLSTQPASWVSLNLGVLLCIDCSGAHRSLGSHISKVRSVHMDTLSASQVLVLKRLGNQVANRVWEEKADLALQAKQTKDGKFAHRKYEMREFVDMSAPYVLSDIFKAALADDVPKLLWLVAHDAPLDNRGPSMETALHVAAHAGNEAASEFLLLNGARMDILDAAGKSAADVATGGAIKVLQTWTDYRRVLATEAL